MSRSKPLALFVEMEFPGAPLYLNSSRLQLEWAGKVYRGVGQLGRIAPVKDTPATLPQIEFELSGVAQENLALALNEGSQAHGVLVRILMEIGRAHV